MGLAAFARRIVGLQAVFPSSSQTIPYPDTLDGTVSPVYLFPSSPASLDRVQRGAATSNSDVTPFLNLGALGQGFYEEWLYASIFHDEIAAQIIVMNIVDPSGAAVQLGRFNVASATSVNLMGAASTATTPIPFERVTKIWVPPGFEVRFVGSTAGVPYSFTIQRLLVVHPLAEPPVWP